MPVEIIAEIANAHQGDPRTAATLAERAFAAGADAVKFQIYFADELLVERHPRFAHFSDQAFDAETWAELIPAATEKGSVYCDVFGPRALETALAHGAAGVKVHSSDTGNMTLLHQVADGGCRAFLSAGGTTARELHRAIDVFVERGFRPVLLHGFQSYPTQVEASNLARLAWLGETFGNVADIGYADHVAGDDPFAHILPAMALGYGICVIEKHVICDRSAQGVDYYSSIDVQTLGTFIDTMRQAESAIGDVSGHFVPSERTYRDSIKKHFVAVSDLPAGHVLEAKDMDMKRVPDVTGDAVALEMLTGRALLRDVPIEHRLTRTDVACRVWALPVARSASSRLPGKALLDVAGMPALGHMFERLKRIEMIDRIVFCTTDLAEDDVLADLAQQYFIPCHRGPVDDVLARMLGAMTDVLVACDTEGRIQQVNPALEAIVGKKERALIGRPIAELFQEKSQDAVTGFLQALRTGGNVSQRDISLAGVGRATCRPGEMPLCRPAELRMAADWIKGINPQVPGAPANRMINIAGSRSVTVRDLVLNGNMNNTQPSHL